MSIRFERSFGWGEWAMPRWYPNRFIFVFCPYPIAWRKHGVGMEQVWSWYGAGAEFGISGFFRWAKEVSEYSV
ncbi:hypothetical protein, partial [uncultured Bacteroides sp.]|uniref:hypothetical protein n=1 Tax=uncultured Bacteroides sp. TaxID=162156 RepID=UPI002616ECF5